MNPLAEYIFPEPNTGCWLWGGRSERTGYGTIMLGGKRHYAHRAMFEFENGAIPDGMFVLHTCDVPCCVNPNHLYLGNQSRNMKDVWDRDRNRAMYGERHPHAKLNADAARDIMNLSVIDAMAKYGVARTTVESVKHGKTWWRATGLGYVKTWDGSKKGRKPNKLANAK